MSMSGFGVAIPLLLLLEAVQDEHRFRERHRVDCSIRAAGIVFADLQHADTTEALEHLRCIVLVAHLCQRQRVTEPPTHVGRQRHQILVAAPDLFERFSLSAMTTVYTCSSKRASAADARRVSLNKWFATSLQQNFESRCCRPQNCAENLVAMH